MDKSVVVIGGGTGISSVLRGLKTKTEHISAIVTMADDGGHSGSLRRDRGILPPGDVRNCLIALANTEPAMEELLQYRYGGGPLEGQNLGNLLIAALNDLTGDFEEALRQLSKVLKVTGEVLPVTVENVNLMGSFDDGTRVFGESAIARYGKRHGREIRKVAMVPSGARASHWAVEAIERGDAIVIGPGSLYTSLIPNLLFPEVLEAIMNSKAPVLYIANMMSQGGETQGMGLSQHIAALERHGLRGRIHSVLWNSSPIPEALLKRYLMEENAFPIPLKDGDLTFLKQRGIQLVEGDYLEDSGQFIRHSGEKLALEIENILSEN
ncbi:MAG: uridine diphosphate-N-acetylglucosamine-binding protein YvcK [Tissierellia bacterium]|nr:uridine diphosphate-N-acetylglucosamine-binding protein YvcK [Tissierellia bacterium]